MVHTKVTICGMHTRVTIYGLHKGRESHVPYVGYIKKQRDELSNGHTDISCHLQDKDLCTEG